MSINPMLLLAGSSDPLDGFSDGHTTHLVHDGGWFVDQDYQNEVDSLGAESGTSSQPTYGLQLAYDGQSNLSYTDNHTTNMDPLQPADMLVSYAQVNQIGATSEADSKVLDDLSSGESTYVLGVQAEAAVEPISEVSIHLGTPTLPYGTNIQNILDRFRENGLLCRLITYITQATWYRNPGAGETLDDSLLEELVSAKFMKPGDSPFRPFFTKDANHYCIICPNSQIPRRSLERALGHARGHFEHTIDGKFTNENTKKDVVSRKAKNGGRHECFICFVAGAPRKNTMVSVQNKSRHEKSQTHLNNLKKLEAQGMVPAGVFQQGLRIKQVQLP